MKLRQLFYAVLLLAFPGLVALSCNKIPESEKEVVATSVKMSQDVAEMLVDETVQLYVSITPSDAKDRPVIWASSKKSVATVSETGFVTAVAEGESTITATVDGLSSSCRVIVEKGDVPVASVSLNRESLALNKGESAALKATVLPKDATNPSVNWSSSDNNVAEVDQTGIVTARNGGTATIVARAGSQSAECLVTVSVPVESLKLDPVSVELKVGETASVSAQVFPEDATDKTVIWTSSDESVVTVSDGVLSAVTPGEATITAQCGEVYATCNVTVLVAFSGLCLEAIQAGTITIDSSPMNLTVEYSRDGLNWTSETADYIYINLKEGECVYLRGNNKTYAATIDETSYVTNIQGTAPFYAYGDLMSLVDAENFESGIRLTEKKALSYLFTDCTNLYNHPEKDIVLSARVLSEQCYLGMFRGCINLTRAPALPATALADECYKNMFYGCTALRTAPELSSKELYYGCYGGMFWGCSSLVSAPVLPATRVADSAYASMFRDCTSLTSPPALPATELSDKCYVNMFYGCTSLEMTPSLPAAIMKYQCYAAMFRDCTGLKRCTTGWLPSKNLAEECYKYMFSNCTSLEISPSLPAEQLAKYCYAYMFYKCSALKSAPVLPATVMAQGCYMDMFRDCTSLTAAPELPSTKLAQECYTGMFWGCTSLQSEPSLPATTLQVDCYASMFRGCTSLTTAPVLPALDLVDYCYFKMFAECSSLSYIEAWFTTTPNTLYTQEWVYGVPRSGTFIKNGNAPWSDVYSTYAIPSGWSVYVTYP